MVDQADTVTLPRVAYQRLAADAGSWRLLNRSPHVAELLAEWMEWDTRRQSRESSWDISALRGRWNHLTYAELERRRRLVSVLSCARCGTAVEMVHPFLDEDWNMPSIRCGRCVERTAV
ncbi:hypothetical protein [Actinophytocola sediminis]